MRTIRLALLFLTCLVLFQKTTSASPITINFDSLSSGTLVSMIDGVTFSTNIIGYDLVVSQIFETTSGSNYLGVNDGGLEVFLPGDVITLSFDSPITALSLDFISSPGTPGGVFGISTPFGSAVSDFLPTMILSDGGEVFLVSFSSIDPFSQVDLTSASEDLYSYNVDDITFSIVPEPATIFLLGSGLAIAIICRKRRL
jgi:hypothetical protein